MASDSDRPPPRRSWPIRWLSLLALMIAVGFGILGTRQVFSDFTKVAPNSPRLIIFAIGMQSLFFGYLLLHIMGTSVSTYEENRYEVKEGAYRTWSGLRSGLFARVTLGSFAGLDDAIVALHPRLALEYAVEAEPAPSRQYNLASLGIAALFTLQLGVYAADPTPLGEGGAALLFLLSLWCRLKAVRSVFYRTLLKRATNRLLTHAKRPGRPPDSSDVELLVEAAGALAERFGEYRTANEVADFVERQRAVVQQPTIESESRPKTRTR